MITNSAKPTHQDILPEVTLQLPVNLRVVLVQNLRGGEKVLANHGKEFRGIGGGVRIEIRVVLFDPRLQPLIGSA